MKNLFKKTTSFLLAFLLFASAAIANPAAANAEIKSLYESPALETAVAGTPSTYDFTITQECEVGFLVYTAAPTAFTLNIYNSAGSAVISPLQITASDSLWTESEGVYMNGDSYNLPAGDYSAALTFDEPVQFLFYIAEDTPDAKISNSKVTITAGFTRTLTVTGNKDEVTWSSSNASVAAVNSNGKVTAKKAGSAVITASVDGKELTCKVTVKNNKYSATKYSNSQIPNGQVSVEAYSASYNSKGDLVIKVRIVNNSSHTVEALKGFSVKVKDADKKTVGTYKTSKKNITVARQGAKNFSVTIKKSALKIKKADLRNADITTAGKYVYTTYVYR